MVVWKASQLVALMVEIKAAWKAALKWVVQLVVMSVVLLVVLLDDVLADPWVESLADPSVALKDMKSVALTAASKKQ